MDEASPPPKEEDSVLDVHPPHEPIHGWRDFLLHLFTITIGLLIALSLEGCLEWQHHRHLVHQAEASLRTEIQANAAGLKGTVADLHRQQATLSRDVLVLNQIIQNPTEKNTSPMEITLHMQGFADVSWKTAQTTGALAYMPYARAQEYANIYEMQAETDLAQHQAVRDAVLSLAPFVGTKPGDPNPGAQQAVQIKQQIGVLQGQLFLLDALVATLDGQYVKFLAAHPD